MKLNKKVMHSLFWSLLIPTQNLLYYYCLTAYSYLFDAFIKVIQPVPKKASGAFFINMHVLECDS